MTGVDASGMNAEPVGLPCNLRSSSVSQTDSWSSHLPSQLTHIHAEWYWEQPHRRQDFVFGSWSSWLWPHLQFARHNRTSKPRRRGNHHSPTSSGRFGM